MPAWAHCFVGAGNGPCILFMTDGRTRVKDSLYSLSELARRYDAGVEAGTRPPSEAYSHLSHWQPECPWNGNELPWAENAGP